MPESPHALPESDAGKHAIERAARDLMEASRVCGAVAKVYARDRDRRADADVFKGLATKYIESGRALLAEIEQS